MARYFNIPFYTLGGTCFWQDIALLGDWRVQKNLLSSSYRVLDGYNIRRARGDKLTCLSELNKFWTDWELEDTANEITLFLNGFAFTPSFFNKIARKLLKSGFNAKIFHYSPTLSTIKDNSTALSDLLSRLPANIKTVNFVTIGFGGMVLRQALSISDAWKSNIALGKVVMIAPPNNGSIKAEKWKNNLFFRIVVGKALRVLRPSEAKKVPLFTPNTDFSVIAGDCSKKGQAPNDGLLYANETTLSGMKHFLILRHSFLRIASSKDVINSVIRYFKLGRFSLMRSSVRQSSIAEIVKPATDEIKIQSKPSSILGLYKTSEENNTITVPNFVSPAIQPEQTAAQISHIQQVTSKKAIGNTKKNSLMLRRKRVNKEISPVYFTPARFTPTTLIKTKEKSISSTLSLASSITSMAKVTYEATGKAFTSAKNRTKKIALPLKTFFTTPAKPKETAIIPTTPAPKVSTSHTTTSIAVPAKAAATTVTPVATSIAKPVTTTPIIKPILKKAVTHAPMPKKLTYTKPTQQRAWRTSCVEVLTSSNGVSSYFTPFSQFLNT